MYKFLVIIKYPIWDFIVISPIVEYLGFPFFIITNIMQEISLGIKAAFPNPSVPPYFRLFL